MANTTTPFGAIPVSHFLGVDWAQGGHIYYVGTGDSTAIGRGDYVSLAGSADTTGKYPTIARTAAGGAILGVAYSFGTNPDVLINVSNLSENYRAASVARYVLVLDDPFIIYKMKEDSVGNNIDADMIGLATDIATVTDCNTTTGISTMALDSSDTATAGGQVRLLGVDKSNGNALGANCDFLVMINEHQLMATTDI